MVDQIKKAKEGKEEKNGALFIPAGVITGLGVGLLVNNAAAGMMIGLGLGFVIFATLTAFRK